VLVQWARRQQGLVVRREDERRFQRLSILRGQRVVRRQDGAGSRLLLDRLLKDAGVATNEVIWTPTPAHSETEVAILVASGEAEAGLAVQSTARQMNLGFIPLATERFDIAVWRSSFFGASFQTLWRFCTGESFKARAATLGGYDLSEFGVVQFNGP
jgi:putative molybdopterin biosynthesis protein